MKTYNEIRKKRYQVYRALGYNSRTASALSNRALDVSGVELSKRTGNLKRNKQTKEYIASLDRLREDKLISDYQTKIKSLKNDTVYTRHGMLTHDKRYKGENAKIVSIIKYQNRLSTNQAYYFFYFMTQSGLTYEQAKAQLLTSKEFEMYDKRRKGR